MPAIQIPKEFLTEKIWKTGFRGVFVGGCIERKEGSSFHAKAHAHCKKSDPYRGWVCIRSYKRIFKVDGRPSRLLIHEVAHLLVPSYSHNKYFKKARLKLQKEIETKSRQEKVKYALQKM